MDPMHNRFLESDGLALRKFKTFTLKKVCFAEGILCLGIIRSKIDKSNINFRQMSKNFPCRQILPFLAQCQNLQLFHKVAHLRFTLKFY